MWDLPLAHLLTDYRVGFQCISSSQHVCRAGEGSKERKGVQYALDEEEVTEDFLLAQICHEVTELVFTDEEDSRCISLVLEEYFQKKEAQSVSGSVPPRKTRKTTSSSASKQDYSELSTLLSSRMKITFLLICMCPYEDGLYWRSVGWEQRSCKMLKDGEWLWNYKYYLRCS